MNPSDPRKLRAGARVLALLVTLSLGVPAAVSAVAQELDPRGELDSLLPELPPTPEDAVEVQVQEELDRATERIEATLAGVAAGAASGGAADAEAVAVDLAAAVALALERNPALRAVEEQREEVAAGVVEVKADAYPQVAATSSYSISRNPSFLNSPDFEDILEQFPGGDFTPGEQELYSAGVEVSQPLYTFGKIRAAIDLARLVVDVTEAQIGAARLETALAAAVAYYDVLSAREALAVGVVQHRVRREALEVVRARYELGEATRLELLRAQAAVAEVTPEIARLTGSLEVAHSRLRNVLGVPPGTAVTVTGGLEVDLPALGEGERVAVPAAPAAGAPAAEAVQDAAAVVPVEGEGGLVLRRSDDLPPVPGFAALWDVARANRPEIYDLELQAEVLERRQVVTRAEGRPQVELNGFFGREARLYDNLTDDLYDNYAVSVGLRWEFFDGGRRRGQIAQLESQRQQLGFELRDLLDAIQLEIEQSLTAYRTARERWQAAQTAATAAREASRVARESYREGVALQTDWLDAQRQEAEAEIQAVAAYYLARQEAARLARALGAYPTEERFGAVVAGELDPVVRLAGADGAATAEGGDGANDDPNDDLNVESPDRDEAGPPETPGAGPEERP